MRQMDTKWFKDQIRDTKQTQRKLAQFLKLDPSAVTLMFSGRRDVTLEEAAKIAQFLGQPLMEILRRAGIPDDVVNRKNRINVVGSVDENDSIHPTKDSAFLSKPHELPEHAEAVVYKTAMTQKDIMDGWVFFYVPSEDVSVEAVGRLCVVLAEHDDKPKVRFVRRRYSTGLFAVSRLNSTDHEEVKLQYAAPVCLIRT